MIGQLIQTQRRKVWLRSAVMENERILFFFDKCSGKFFRVMIHDRIDLFLPSLAHGFEKPPFAMAIFDKKPMFRSKIDAERAEPLFHCCSIAPAHKNDL